MVKMISFALVMMLSFDFQDRGGNPPRDLFINSLAEVFTSGQYPIEKKILHVLWVSISSSRASSNPQMK